MRTARTSTSSYSLQPVTPRTRRGSSRSPVPLSAGRTPSTTTTAPAVKVVPDVRRQAFVFAKVTLGDSGFAWRVTGAVQGYASNTVASQSPAPGTRVLDTGAPRIELHLARGAGAQTGV